MGEGNWIGPYCVISGETRIGSGNCFRSHVVVGTPPEKAGHFFKNGETFIGDNNLFSEHVTIHSGSEHPTYVGNNCVFLTKSHIGHDAMIYDHATISCLVAVGGHAIVMRGANLGLGAKIHQFQVVGSFAMVGMNSTVTKKCRVLPGGVYAGTPTKLIRQNVVGLKKHAHLDISIPEEVKVYRELLKQNGML